MSDEPVGPVGDPEPAADKDVAKAAPLPPAVATALKGDTSYVMLSLGDEAWKYEKNVEARSAEAAVRTFIGDIAALKVEEIVVVAIPERSWKPVKVTAKVTTSLVIEEAS